MNDIMERILKVIDGISGWSGKIVAFGIICNCLIVGCEVFLRYVLHTPIYWGLELNLFIYGIYMMMGAGYTLLDHEHVSMDAIYMRLSGKRRLSLDVFSHMIIIAFLALGLWHAINYSMESWRVMEISDSMWGPVFYPFKTFIPLGFFIILLQALANFVRIIKGSDTTKNVSKE